MSKGPTDAYAMPVQMLTVAEVAEMTGMSMAFWRREIRLKQIPVTHFGRAVRVTPVDLNAYIARRQAAKRR